MKRSLLVSIFLLAPALSAMADANLGIPSRYAPQFHDQQVGLSRAYEECMKEGSGNTGLALECYDKELVRQDKQLNIAYQAALKRLPPARAEALKESQRAWLRMRKPHCDLERENSGGTLDLLIEASCNLVATAYRARYLERLE